MLETTMIVSSSPAATPRQEWLRRHKSASRKRRYESMLGRRAFSDDCGSDYGKPGRHERADGARDSFPFVEQRIEHRRLCDNSMWKTAFES
jgi:hypothetical protein